MTTIKASCPTCGEVVLAPADIEVRRGPGERTASYSFVCPHCYSVIHKPADDRIVALLVAAGVAVTEPAPRPLAARFGHDPITYDDLLDFHVLLERDDWLDHVLRDAPASSGQDPPDRERVR